MSEVTFSGNVFYGGDVLFLSYISSNTLTGCTFSSNGGSSELANPQLEGVLKFEVLESDALAITDSLFDGNYLHNGAAVGFQENPSFGFTGTPSTTQV